MNLWSFTYVHLVHESKQCNMTTRLLFVRKDRREVGGGGRRVLSRRPGQTPHSHGRNRSLFMLPGCYFSCLFKLVSEWLGYREARAKSNMLRKRALSRSVGARWIHTLRAKPEKNKLFRHMSGFMICIKHVCFTNVEHFSVLLRWSRADVNKTPFRSSGLIV